MSRYRDRGRPTTTNGGGHSNGNGYDDNPFDPQGDYDDGGGWEPIMPGRHVVQVTGAYLGTSKKGDPMITTRLTVLVGDDAGKSCRDYLLVVGRFFWKLARLCKAIDPDMKGKAQDPNGFDPFDQSSIREYLLGAPLAVDISERDGEKAKLTQIDTYYACSSDELDKLEEQYNEGGGELVPELPADAEGWAP